MASVWAEPNNPGIGGFVAGGLYALAVALAVLTRRDSFDSPWDIASAAPAGWRSAAVMLTGLAALTILSRIVLLSSFPWRLDGDAAALAREASYFLGPNPPPLIGTGWWGSANQYFFTQSLVLRAFGKTILGIRAMGAAGGVLTVLFTFLFARAALGWRTALCVTLIAAVMPYQIAYSRAGNEMIHVVWLTAASLWLGLAGWDRRSLWRFVLAGMACGAAQYAYASARLLPVLLAALIILLAWQRQDGEPRRFRFAMAALVLAAIGTLIVYAPMLYHYAQQPQEILARIGPVSVFKEGWLDAATREMGPRAFWLQQAWRAYLSFFYPTGGLLTWFRPPYLTPIESVLALFGLICLWVRCEAPAWLRWFIAVFLFAGMTTAGLITIDTPSPTRYVLLAFPITLAAGYGLKRLLDLAALSFGRDRFALGAMTCVPLAVAANGLFSYVALEDFAFRYYLNATDRIATEASRALLVEDPPPALVLFLGDAGHYFSAHPALPFLLRSDGVDVPEGAGCWDIERLLRPGLNAIIAPAHRIGELATFRPKELSYREYQDGRGEPVFALMMIQRSPDNSSSACG